MDDVSRAYRGGEPLDAPAPTTISDMDVFVVAGARTPTARFGGSLARYSAVELGAVAVSAVLQRGPADVSVDELLLGNVVAANCGQNIARQVALAAGLPHTTVATTVNKVCSSGLKAVTLAAAAIRARDINVAVAGGSESMTNTPYYLPHHRWGARYGTPDNALVDGLTRDGLTNAEDGVVMGIAGDLAAAQANISRQDADEMAILTFKRAQRATAAGFFRDEIVPMDPKPLTRPSADDKTGPLDFDEGINALREDKVPKLKPCFDKKNGICTAANSSPLSDGASAVMLVSGLRLKELIAEHKLDDISVIFKVRSYADFELPAMDFPFAPVGALRSAAEKSGISVESLAVVEVNEAFATVPIILSREMSIPMTKINPNGGALAIGHPLGSSGSRILITLMSALSKIAQHRCNRAETPDSALGSDSGVSGVEGPILGAATICNGGGGATAIILECLTDF